MCLIGLTARVVDHFSFLENLSLLASVTMLTPGFPKHSASISLATLVPGS